eukprot:8962830-Heterocapsa_arctica.AAC.1
MHIQEHWILKEDLESWKTLGKECGRLPNKQRNNEDGVTGRSGGVAILTWNGRLGVKSEFEADYSGWSHTRLGQKKTNKDRAIAKEATHRSETD